MEEEISENQNSLQENQQNDTSIDNNENFTSNDIQQNDEDYSSENELRKSAFPLDADENDSDEGLAYLLQVRQEASKISNKMLTSYYKQEGNKKDDKEQNQQQKKQIENSKIQYKYNSVFEKSVQIQINQTNSQDLEDQEISLQKKQWEQLVLEQFDVFRKHIENGKKLYQQKNICLDKIIQNYQGINIEIINNKQIFQDNFMENSNKIPVIVPQLELLIQIDYLMLEKLIEWVHQSLFNQKKNGKISNYNQLLWTYSLLGLLEKPIVLEICDILIKILRICLYNQTKYENEKTDYEQYKVMNDVIILIIREYFEQKIYK